MRQGHLLLPGRGGKGSHDEARAPRAKLRRMWQEQREAGRRFSGNA